MINELRECYRYRYLLSQLVVRDIKVRYKNSVLGFFWSLANPLLQVATITIVIKYIMGLKVTNYSAYLLAGYLPWMFFQLALLDSSQVILIHRELLRKSYFPREVLPMSVVGANLVHYVLSLVVFFAYLLFYRFFLHGAPITGKVLLLPALMLIQSCLVMGLAFFISCMNVFYEDIKYLLTALLNVFFYLTPVMYPAELVHDRLIAIHPLLYKAYLLLPMNALTDAYRKTLLPTVENLKMRGGIEVHTLPLDYGMLGIAAALSVLFAIAGYRFFNARKWVFAERI